MKKYLLTFVLILGCALCVVGCDKTDKDYWTPVSTELTTFFASDEYQSPSEIQFGEKLTTLISSDFGQDYAELINVYIPLYKQTVFCAQKYAQVLAFTPSNKSVKLKSAFKEISSNLIDYKEQINSFKTSKNNYESYITFTDKNTALSDQKLTRLSNFKVDFLELITSAYNLSNSVYQAYTIGYHDFANYAVLDAESFTAEIIKDDQKLALNSVNMQLSNTAIKVLKLYVTKEQTSDYDDFWQISQTFYTAMQSQYGTELEVTDFATALKNFKTWKGVYDLFIQDSKHFENVIENIKVDVLKECKNDADKYAEKIGSSKAKSEALFFINYHNNVEYLYNYTITLI